MDYQTLYNATIPNVTRDSIMKSYADICTLLLAPKGISATLKDSLVQIDNNCESAMINVITLKSAAATTGGKIAYDDIITVMNYLRTAGITNAGIYYMYPGPTGYDPTTAAAPLGYCFTLDTQKNTYKMAKNTTIKSYYDSVDIVCTSYLDRVDYNTLAATLRGLYAQPAAAAAQAHFNEEFGVSTPNVKN